MKAIRKNIYAVGVIFLFVLAAAMLALFLALFSSSTSVDSTAVGSIYIGDTKPGSKLREDTLKKEANKWKKEALYTITFQEVNYVIGQTEVTETNPETNETTTYYRNEGLVFLSFNYEDTIKNIEQNSSNNLAFFDFDPDNQALFKADLVKYFGSEITDDNIFDFTGLVKSIKENAQKMNSIETFDLYDYTSSDWNSTEVWSETIKNLSKNTVDNLVEAFEKTEIEILPQKDEKGKLGFSAVEFFSQPDFTDLTSSEMSVIATGIAAVVMPTSMIVTVKNQGYECYSYYGAMSGTMTARVNIKDNTDLRIINPESHSYKIKISRGPQGEDLTESLRFILYGCKFINKYVITPNEESYGDNISIVYDYEDKHFNYEELDVDNDHKGIDTSYNGGCYYWIYQDSKPTKLYSYTKRTYYVDGTYKDTEVFPKQEFFAGKNELRYWTKDGYKG